MPLSLSYFHPFGAFANMTSAYVHQNVQRRGTSDNSGIDDFDGGLDASSDTGCLIVEVSLA